MKTKGKLKLYVWEGVLGDHTSGVMFALAYNEEHARKQILKHTPYVSQKELNLKPDVYSRPIGFALYGGG